ncbi:MAG TPA: hypothetical protein VN874_08950 [Myxococcales bacterium]|jgi:hypothetical protein|nr:hypothetical protein [Myxococcales bacterium]
MSAADRRLAWGLALATGFAMAATQGPVGFTRDEGYYFAAAQSYEQWISLLLQHPAQALAAPALEHFWSYNFEHPGLGKLLFAASHFLFSTTLGWLPETFAWRLPAFAFAGLLSLWLSELGFARSRAAGVLAPLLFWCAARTFFHGHLAAFDLPICALTAGVGVAWARALGLLEVAGAPQARAEARVRWQDGARLSFVYGCALGVKHNAWFLPPVLLLHALLCAGSLRRRALRALPWLLASPLVLFASWPLLWHDPLRHLRDWVLFHTHHVHYAWWYLGDLYRAPPFPHAYPLVLDALVLPATTVVLLALAFARLLWHFAARRLPPFARGATPLSALRLLELGLASAAVLPFVLGTTPIFGGIKHWLAFPALLAPEAADVLVRGARAAAESAQLPARAAAFFSGSRVVALSAFAVLLPGLVQIARVHPYGTSAYGELAGGIPGAASLGLQRQYWSGNVTAVLPWINRNVPRDGRVYFHEVNVESYRAYQISGALRRDIQYASSPEASDYAAIQWHREFRDVEPRVWNAFGTRRPATGLYLDEVVQVVVYARPGFPGAN